MSFAISRRDIDDAYASMRDAHNYIRNYSNQGETVVGQVVQTLEVTAGAFGVGVLSGRYGPLQIAGSKIPLDLAGGLVLHGLAFFGLAGKYGEHMHNFADGVLASYATKYGVGVGNQMAREAGAVPPQVTAGAVPRQMGSTSSNNKARVGCGAPLTEAELAGMAHSLK